MGRIVESDNSVNKIPPSPERRTLARFLALAGELRTRANGQRDRTRVRRFRGKRRLAQEGSSKGAGSKVREGEGPPTLRKILREGKLLYNRLTIPERESVSGDAVVSSRPSPLPFTKRSMIGAALALQRELKEGKVLPMECSGGASTENEGPANPKQTGGEHPVHETVDEPLNLMTCYDVELHSKLMETEDNRAHMRSYINFELDAEGDDDLGEHEPMYDTTELPGDPPTDRGTPVPSTETMYIPPDIRGGDTLMSDGRTLKEWLIEVCDDLKPVFNTKVRPTPARVTPMRLVVDESIWEDSANALPPRHHSQAKHEEVHKQVNKMLPLGVISESQAEYYSQVHLTPKPTPGEWRFCIDYRRLNAASKGMGWPIPNIPDMLRRLGNRKAKVFCKLDLTAGYHQAPLEEASRKYTAFRTARGLYSWNRVPMGLKGAPSYFQHVMQSEVLQGLQ